MTTNDLIKQAEVFLEIVGKHEEFSPALANTAKSIIRQLIAKVKEHPSNLLLAVEFGYRHCEQSHNLEATLSEYKAMIAARPKEKP